MRNKNFLSEHRTSSRSAPLSLLLGHLGCQTLFAWTLLALVFSGCSTTQVSSPRRFDFAKDTFSFPNELVWEYHYDANGKWVTNRRDPPASYSQHCFVLARAALLFFEKARFDPNLPRADEAEYRRLIGRVIHANPRHNSEESDRVVIPGYADLRSFSAAEESLLKKQCGGGWESYFQRGHWRMIFPFSRGEQSHMAAQLVEHLASQRPAVVHVVRFPQLTINHAIVFFQAAETDKEINFKTYDPNNPKEPVNIRYDKSDRTFYMAANEYFPGGRVDIYQVYHRWDY